MTESGAGSERRRHPRAKKRFQVRFGPGDLAHSGYTQDVSESGLYLQASIIYPPNTILVLQIEYAEGPVTVRGVVRWSKDLPPAFKRSLRCGMGVEFVEGVPKRPEAASAAAIPAPKSRPAPPRTGVPPEAGDQELGSGSTRRRQVSTMAGNTFEVLQTEYRGAWYIRIFQLPKTDGSSEAAFRGAFWNREAAEAAVKGFLKDR